MYAVLVTLGVVVVVARTLLQTVVVSGVGDRVEVVVLVSISVDVSVVVTVAVTTAVEVV